MNMRELSSEEFSQFTKNYNQKSVYQTSEYAKVMEKQGYKAIFVGLTDEINNILAAALVLIKVEHGFNYGYIPRGFLIDYNNAELLRVFTREIKKFLGHREVMAIKLCPMVVRNVYDPKYKVNDKNEYYDEIFNNFKKLGYYHFGYNNYFEALKPRFEAILDISSPFYILFDNVKKEYRTKIRKASTDGVNIYKGDESNLNYLYLQTKKKYERDYKYFEDVYESFKESDNVELYYTTLNTKEFLQKTQDLYSKAEAKSLKYSDMVITGTRKNPSNVLNKKMHFDTIFEQYKKQLVTATKLLKDYPDGIVTSSALIIKKEDTIYLFMDGYNNSYKNINSKHLLLWKLVEKYSKLGYKKFNFGGVSNVMIEDNTYKGLNDFKINFNCKIYEYMGDLELITNQTLYFVYRNSSLFRKIFKKEPGSVQ